MNRIRLALLFLLAVFVSSGITYLATLHVAAHGGNTNLIHGCIASHGVVNGFVRIITAGGTCAVGETPLDWNAQDVPGTGAVSIEPVWRESNR